MIRSSIASLIISCLLSTSLYAEGCKVSQIQERDGYIVASQTQQADDGDLAAGHILALIGGIMSTLKLVNGVCFHLTPAPLLPTVSPSYIAYNAAGAANAFVTITSIMGTKDESEQKLEAYIGEKANVEEQIAAFEAAYQQQMATYHHTKSREEVFEIIGLARKGAVVAAGVEAFMFGLPIYPAAVVNPPYYGFWCYPNPAAAAAAMGITTDALTSMSDSVGSLAESADAAETFASGGISLEGMNGANTSVGAIVEDNVVTGGETGGDWTYSLGSGVTNLASLAASLILSVAVGEVTPMNRLIFYSGMELLAMTTSGQTASAADCMKQRADEYKNFADALRARLATTVEASPNDGVETTSGGASTEVNTVNIETASSNLGDSLTNGCFQSGASSFVDGIDSDCSCQQAGNCFQTQSLGSTDSLFAGASFSVPSGVANGIIATQRLANSVFRGDSRGAGLAASQIKNSAFAIKKAEKQIKDAINKNRKNKGLPEIDFAAEERKAAAKIRSGIQKFMNENNIRSIDDVNKLLKSEGSIKLAKASPTIKLDEGNGTTSAKKVNPFKGYDTELNNDGTAALSDSQNNLSPEEPQGLEELFASGAGISGKAEDLFKIISIRHMKSAYPVFLEKNPKREQEKQQ